LREKEFICRDKHMDINDHKKIIDSLRFALEQLKKQRDGLDHQLKLMVSMFDLEMPCPLLSVGNKFCNAAWNLMIF
jgi:hypothetical protein